MKLFIASDIHGSEYYCNEMLKSFNNENADKMLLLGDVLYHGPRNELPKDYCPKKVISMLNDIKDKILCVRGNCDTEVDQMVLEFPILSDYITLCDSDTVIYATHGHVYNQNNVLPFAKGSVLLGGHTHVPKVEVYDDYIYMNPGSVSIPKEDSHHGYMIFENKEFIWKDFEGKVINSFKL